MTFVGLALIAIGTGGIKPCVSAFGGDQFKLPEQERQLQTFFSVFYFSINAGSFISTIVTPILREDVHCFGDKTCYSLAFGVPAALMAIALVIIIMGKPLYKMNPPQGNIVFKVVDSIRYGIFENIKGSRGNSHWMDVGKAKYGDELVEDVKSLLRVLVLFLPVPIWWTLFDQTGSRWTFQATRMDGTLGASYIKPDQMQVINPILILILLPIFDKIIYPLCAKCNFLKKPLQRMVVGGLICAASFVISGVLELELQKTYAKIPDAASKLSDINLMSNLPCPVTIKMLDDTNTVVFEDMINSFENKIQHDMDSGSYTLNMEVNSTCLPQILNKRQADIPVTLLSGNVSAVVLGTNGGDVLPVVLEKEDDPKKDNDAIGKLRVVYDIKDSLSNLEEFSFKLMNDDHNSSHEFNLTEDTIATTEYQSVEVGTYR